MSFRNRLVVFLVGTLVAVQVLTAAFAYVYLRQHLIDRAKRELTAEMGVFTRQLEFLSERVTDAVKVLSLDYALRSAIAQHDHGTELSALRNHGQRIGAARMMLLGLGGEIAADTLAPQQGTGKFPLPRLLQTAGAQDKATALAAFNGRIYWIVVVPVRAPIPIAFIAAFIPVNDLLLERLRSISAEPRTIMLATRTKNGWRLAARSLVHLRHVNLPATAVPPATWASETMQDGENYLTITAPLHTAAGTAPVVAILSYPLGQAFAAYRSIIIPLLLVLGIALLAAIAGAGAIVRGVSRPLEILAAAARRIASGDYSRPPEIRQRDEVGHLADALANMTHSIAERENALRSAVEATEFARNEAVRANDAKSQFLANMSHEFRTPLNAVVGLSEMIARQELGPVGVPRYLDYASDIRTSGEHLLALVERMLDLAEADSERLVLERRPVCPTILLRESVLGLKPFADKSGVLLLVKDFDQCPQILGDAARLRQAFVNILHNAVKFTPAGGEVQVKGCAQAGHFTIGIADTGIGMEPEVLAVVVRPFHRLRSALDGQHQGAGLGLPFARMIVELHGGALSVESAVGIGTTVSIELPLADAMSRAA